MKKILCLLLSVCMLFSVVSFGASALAAKDTEPDLTFASLGTVESLEYDPTTKLETTHNSVSAVPFYSNGTAQPFTFYTQLNENQKAVYNSILADPLKDSYEVTLPEPITCNVPVPADGNIQLPQDVNDDLMATAIGGLTALTDDHPEIFWMSGFQAGFGFSYLIKDDGTMDIMISALSIAITLNTAAYSSWDEVFSTYHEMLAAVEAFPVHGFTRYEKLKSMHDGIASQVVYDPNLGTAGENPTDHEPTSVFLEPFTTVCEGYAEAFQLLCQREGIPCITVVGTANGGGHAWNYVQMEDGVWYAVDLTWDDQGDIMYDFFLVGSQTQNCYFGQTTFSGSHVPNGQRFITDLFALSYPALSRTAYCGVLLNGNADAAANRSKGMLFIGKNQTAASAFILPSGYTLNVSGVTTGGTVSYSGSQGSGSYTLVRRGDINADNSTNRTDYNIVKNTLSGTSNLTAGSASEAAGDMNSDGVVDAFDAALLDLYLNDVPVY